MPEQERGNVAVLVKRRGETPQECVARFRVRHPRYDEVSVSHVGRMEPLCEGALLALLGEENNHRGKYAALSNEYALDVLFGLSTDTFDLLGKVTAFEPSATISGRQISRALNEFRGKIRQQEPAVGSRTVLGKAIADWSKLFKPVGLPEHEAVIYEIALVRAYKAPEAAVLAYALEGLDLVKGDCRQDEVRYLLKRYLSAAGARRFACAAVAITCTPETSPRSIANAVGGFLGVPSVALRCVRTKVGDFEKEPLRVS